MGTGILLFNFARELDVPCNYQSKMPQDQAIKEIKPFIKTGQHAAAIEHLSPIIKEKKNKELTRFFRLIEAKYTNAKKEQLSGVISREGLNLVKNQVAADLLELVDYLLDESQNPFSKAPPPSFFSKGFKNFRSHLAKPWGAVAIGLILLITIILLNYKLQHLVLAYQEETSSPILLGLVIICSILALLFIWGTTFYFFLGQFKSISPPKATTNERKNKLGLEKYNRDRNRLLLQVLKRNGLALSSGLLLSFSLLYLAQGIYRAYGSHQIYVQQLKQYSIENENIKFTNYRESDKQYWIVLNNISETGTMAQKINFYEELKSDLNDEIRTHNLPIGIKETYTEKQIDSLARAAKGVYLIEGHYNDYRARLVVYDRTMYKDEASLVAGKFGLLSSQSPGDVSTNVLYEKIEKEFNSGSAREYIIANAIPKELKYFQMKMIGELMSKEVAEFSRSKEKEVTRPLLAELIKYTEAVLRIAEKNILFQVDHLGFYPRPSSNLFVSDLYLSLSKLYSLESNRMLDQFREDASSYEFNKELFQKIDILLDWSEKTLNYAFVYLDHSKTDNIQLVLLYTQEHGMFIERSELRFLQGQNNSIYAQSRFDRRMEDFDTERNDVIREIITDMHKLLIARSNTVQYIANEYDRKNEYYRKATAKLTISDFDTNGKILKLLIDWYTKNAQERQSNFEKINKKTLQELVVFEQDFHLN